MFTHSRCVAPIRRQGCDLLNWSVYRPYLSRFSGSELELNSHLQNGPSGVHSFRQSTGPLTKRTHSRPTCLASLGFRPLKRNDSIVQREKICLFNSKQPAAILTTDTVMRHLQVHNNEQSHSITVLDVPLCLLNHLSQLLFALCLLLISCIRVRVCVFLCAQETMLAIV